MNKEKYIEVATIGFFICIFVVLFVLLPFLIVRGEFIYLENDDICKYNYGTNYIYIQDEYFGTYCIELIHENLTMKNPEPFDWTWKEIGEMCGRPGDFDITKWDSERCHGEFALGRDYE